jgi:hypothetical protein
MVAGAMSLLQIPQQVPTLIDAISFHHMVLFVDLARHLGEASGEIRGMT